MTNQQPPTPSEEAVKELVAWLEIVAAKEAARPVFPNNAGGMREAAALITALAEEIARLREERDEAVDRADELERDAEIVSVEFEKECWVAVRALLLKVDPKLDFTDGVSADLACEIINDAVNTATARAQAAEANSAAQAERIAELEDKVEGLEADLRCAVETAFRRGALDWTRRNYPRDYERLMASFSTEADVSAATTQPQEPCHD